MIAFCIPMLAIAVILVAASPGFLVAAVACMVMMALMMGGMSYGSDDRN